MTIIFHITQRPRWKAAQEAGEYRVESLESEGFIHASTAAQVMRTANKFYAGQTDLVILMIETHKVGPEVKWEAPFHPGSSQPDTSSADQFPHIYGPLNADAVVSVIDFPLEADGTFKLPDAVANLPK